MSEQNSGQDQAANELTAEQEFYNSWVAGTSFAKSSTDDGDGDSLGMGTDDGDETDSEANASDSGAESEDGSGPTKSDNDSDQKNEDTKKRELTELGEQLMKHQAVLTLVTGLTDAANTDALGQLIEAIAKGNGQTVEDFLAARGMARTSPGRGEDDLEGLGDDATIEDLRNAITKNVVQKMKESYQAQIDGLKAELAELSKPHQEAKAEAGLKAKAETELKSVAAKIAQKYAGFEVTADMVAKAMKEYPEVSDTGRAVEMAHFETLRRHTNKVGTERKPKAPEAAPAKTATPKGAPDRRDTEAYWNFLKSQAKK